MLDLPGTSPAIRVPARTRDASEVKSYEVKPQLEPVSAVLLVRSAETRSPAPGDRAGVKEPQDVLTGRPRARVVALHVMTSPHDDGTPAFTPSRVRNA